MTNMSLWVGIPWNACGLGASEQTRKWLEETMCVALPQLLYLWDLEEQRGRGFKVIIRREGEKPQTRGTFMGRHKKTTQGVDH